MSEESKPKKATKKAADDGVAKDSKKAAKSASASSAESKDAKPAKKTPAKADKPKTEKAEKSEKKAAPKKEKKADAGVKKHGKLVEDIRLYDVIDKPVVTEKSTMAAEQNKVVFRIRPDADKTQIKQAVEALFGVNVTKVNTLKVKGKRKRFRGRPGQRSDYRKAMVTLKEGQSIDLAAGLK